VGQQHRAAADVLGQGGGGARRARQLQHGDLRRRHRGDAAARGGRPPARDGAGDGARGERRVAGRQPAGEHRRAAGEHGAGGQHRARVVRGQRRGGAGDGARDGRRVPGAAQRRAGRRRRGGGVRGAAGVARVRRGAVHRRAAAVQGAGRRRRGRRRDVRGGAGAGPRGAPAAAARRGRRPERGAGAGVPAPAPQLPRRVHRRAGLQGHGRVRAAGGAGGAARQRPGAGACAGQAAVQPAHVAAGVARGAPLAAAVPRPVGGLRQRAPGGQAGRRQGAAGRPQRRGLPLPGRRRRVQAARAVLRRPGAHSVQRARRRPAGLCRLHAPVGAPRRRAGGDARRAAGRRPRAARPGARAARPARLPVGRVVQEQLHAVLRLDVRRPAHAACAPLRGDARRRDGADRRAQVHGRVCLQPHAAPELRRGIAQRHSDLPRGVARH
ncbi:hypothetical protein GGI13_008306, partial [Coemansia sp. RSA 455]